MTNDDLKEARGLVGAYVLGLADDMDEEGEGDAANRLREAWKLLARTEKKESERPEGVPEFVYGHVMPGYFVVVDDAKTLTHAYPNDKRPLRRFRDDGPVLTPTLVNFDNEDDAEHNGLYE